jgi:hypothetical protein
MSHRIGTPGGSCECWAPVVGALLILIGVFDLGFGAVMAAASIELGQVSGVVEANSGLIKVGNALSQATGGLLQFGAAERGAAINEVLRDLPPVWISLILAIGRLLLSLAAIVLGIALAKRVRQVMRPLSGWAIVAAVWGLIAIFFSIGLYRFLGHSSGVAAAGITILLDLAVHVAWPIIVFCRIRLARTT